MARSDENSDSNENKKVDSDGLSVSSVYDDLPVQQIKVVKKKEVTKKETKETKNKKENKKDKLKKFKKYLRVAGIHTRNYDKLFADCKNEKEKIKKIKEILFEKGHEKSAKISIKSCEKLRLKIETEEELRELSKNTILTGKRNC